jgi:hypothetical protein
MAISNLANYKIVRITNRWQPQATCAAGSTSILLLPPPFSLSDYILFPFGLHRVHWSKEASSLRFAFPYWFRATVGIFYH